MTSFRQPLPMVVATALVMLLRPGFGMADTVEGYVLDAVRQERVSGVEVAFLIPSGEGGLTEMARHTSDDRGAFSFSGPFLTPGTEFALVAHYKGVEYGTEDLAVGDQDQTILEVYDGTEVPSHIRINGHHLFLSITTGGIDVAQLVHVANLGEATFVGRTIGVERRVVEFALPEGNLRLKGHVGDIVRASSTRAFDTRPLAPGISQVAFTFLLQGDTFDGEYEHEIIYPTDQLELFIQPSSVSLGTDFEDLGQITLQDQVYRHYRIRDLLPGRTVTVPLPLSRPLRWALKWAMLGLVPVALAASIALSRPVSETADPAPLSADLRTALEQRRQALLAELAQLDAQASTGEEDVIRRRQRLVADTAEVYDRLGLGG